MNWAGRAWAIAVVQAADREASAQLLLRAWQQKRPGDNLLQWRRFKFALTLDAHDHLSRNLRKGCRPTMNNLLLVAVLAGNG
jgi:hypothetical protein